MRRAWRDPLYVIVLLLAGGAALAFALLLGKPFGDAPQAHRGTLDLTEWDLTEGGDGPVKLNGEWEFYPGQLLMPQQLAEQNRPASRFIALPSAWNNIETDGRKMGGWGYGTYRLTVMLGRTDGALAVRTNVIRSANNVFIDGTLRGGGGRPADIRAGYEFELAKQFLPFDQTGGQVDIVIQVANYDYYKGGILQHLVFGSSKEVLRGQLFEVSLEMAAIGVYLALSVFYLALYSFYLRDRNLLVFGCCFLAYALFMLFSGERFGEQLFPGTPQLLLLKIKDFTEIVPVVLIALLTRGMYASPWFRRMMDVVIGGFSLYCLMVAVLPPAVYTRPVDWLYLSIAVAHGMMMLMTLGTYTLGKYGDLGKQGLRLYVLLQLCLCAMYLNNYFVYYSQQYSDLIVTYIATIASMVMITSLLAQRYFHMFAVQQRLTLNMREAAQAKDEFMLRTSHELNTPLHGIMNVSQAMLEQLGKTKQLSGLRARDQLEFLRSTAYRMSNMVNDIIDLSRIRDGRLDMKLTGVDLATCVSVTFEVFAFLAKGKDVQLINKISPDARFATADEQRLMQVLHNVIDSSLERVEGGIVTIGSMERNREIVIVVETTGAVATGKRSYAAFRAAEWKTNDAERAEPGFGFRVSKQLVEQMHGSLQLGRTGSGEGFRFEIGLPVFDGAAIGGRRKEEEQEAAAAISAFPASAEDIEGAYTVLVADDDAMQIELLANILTVEGYRVVAARSQEEALRKIGHPERPDIMLLDVMMSGGSGYAVCREVRAMYSPIDLPVLFVSVRTTPADVEAGLAAGGNDFITRPFDAGEVRARIRTLLAMKRLAKEAADNEMAFLRSQIKPHFLYNALSMIMSLCFTDGPRAGELLGVFSKYLRIIFHLDNTEETVELRTELELVKAYVEIEMVRYGGRIRVLIDADEQLLHYRVMLLTIQPLVENAIRHGLSKMRSGGTVRLSIRGEDGTIRVTVEDDGVGMTEKELRKVTSLDKSLDGVGFANISRRMKHLTGKPPAVESAPGAGTKVTLWIPMAET